MPFSVLMFGRSYSSKRDAVRAQGLDRLLDVVDLEPGDGVTALPRAHALVDGEDARRRP